MWSESNFTSDIICFLAVCMDVASRSQTTGLLKGDALVTYMKRPSVELAITILNGTPFRSDMKQTMSIQEAKFELRGEYRNKKKTKKTKKASLEQHALSCMPYKFYSL